MMNDNQVSQFARLIAVAAVVGTVGLFATLNTKAATFTGLGFLPGGDESVATAVSADGTTVVGYGNSALGRQAFRWVQGMGTSPDLISPLGFLAGGTSSYAESVSADGSTVVGYGNSTLGQQAFRWVEGEGTASDVMSSLGFLSGGDSSIAYGVSADGTTVVGHGSSSLGTQAFRWVEGEGASPDVISPLGFLPGGDSSAARAVSPDGAMLVGYGTSSSGGIQAFRWVEGEGASSDVMSPLGFLPGGAYSVPYGVSADGSTVVGQAGSDLGYQAFHWVEGAGSSPDLMSHLGFLSGGNNSAALAVSADGSTVVGQSNSSIGGNEAFVWDTNKQMRNVFEELVLEGEAMTGWSLSRAAGVSIFDNTLTIVGVGSHNGQNEGWIATFDLSSASPIPTPTTGLMSFALVTLLAIRRKRRTQN